MRYVIMASRETIYYSDISTKLILYNETIDEASSLKLIRKLIIKKLAESFEFILPREIYTMGRFVACSFAFISPIYCAFAISQT